MKIEIFMLGITKGVRESIMSNHVSQQGKQGMLQKHRFALASWMT